MLYLLKGAVSRHRRTGPGVLPAVAEALGTEMVLPQHYPVTNAVRTVVSNVIVRHEDAVTPELKGVDVVGYFSRVANRFEKFAGFQEGLAEARRAGVGEPAVECDKQKLLPWLMSIYLPGQPGSLISIELSLVA
jgi:hypothetical protein